MRTGQEEGDGSLVDNVDSLLLHVDHASNAISKESIGESTSFPQARRHIECEAVCGVWFSHPPAPTYSQLRRIGGGDKGPKTVTSLWKRWNFAFVKAKGLDGCELSFC